MNKTSGTSKNETDKLVKGTKRKTPQKYPVEEKIRIALASLPAEGVPS